MFCISDILIVISRDDQIVIVEMGERFLENAIKGRTGWGMLKEVSWRADSLITLGLRKKMAKYLLLEGSSQRQAAEEEAAWAASCDLATYVDAKVLSPNSFAEGMVIAAASMAFQAPMHLISLEAGIRVSRIVGGSLHSWPTWHVALIKEHFWALQPTTQEEVITRCTPSQLEMIPSNRCLPPPFPADSGAKLPRSVAVSGAL